MEVIILYQIKMSMKTPSNTCPILGCTQTEGLLEYLEPNPSTYFIIQLYHMKPTKSHVETILQHKKY